MGARFNRVRDALSARLIGGLRVGSLSALPASVLNHFATGQLHQVGMLATCTQSACKDASAGETMGAVLAKAFSSDAKIEANMLRFLERCPTPISRPVIETLAGLLPVGTLAMMIIEDHYRDGALPSNKGLMAVVGH